jgi:hypothetical protein
MIAQISGCLVAASLVLTAGATAPSSTPANTCQERCYQEKSQAYQRCRTLPPSDRAARLRCFREADAALQRCLRGCK